MEPFGLVANLWAVRSDEAVVAPTGSKNILEFLIYDTLEEQAAREEVFLEAAEWIDVDLRIDSEAFRVFDDSFQVGKS